MLTVILCTLMCCVTIIICRLINNASLEKAFEHERNLKELENPTPFKKQKSPYSLRRVLHSKSKKWGYCLLEGGGIYTSVDGYYEVNYDIKDAIELLWTMEDLGNYERTKFEFLQDDPGTS